MARRCLDASTRQSAKPVESVRPWMSVDCIGISDRRFVAVRSSQLVRSPKSAVDKVFFEPTGTCAFAKALV